MGGLFVGKGKPDQGRLGVLPSEELNACRETLAAVSHRNRKGRLAGMRGNDLAVVALVFLTETGNVRGRVIPGGIHNSIQLQGIHRLFDGFSEGNATGILIYIRAFRHGVLAPSAVILEIIEGARGLL